MVIIKCIPPSIHHILYRLHIATIWDRPKTRAMGLALGVASSPIIFSVYMNTETVVHKPNFTLGITILPGITDSMLHILHTHWKHALFVHIIKYSYCNGRLTYRVMHMHFNMQFNDANQLTNLRTIDTQHIYSIYPYAKSLSAHFKYIRYM